MRIGRVIGKLTMSRRLKELATGSWLIVEALDRQGLAGLDRGAGRAQPMPQSLVVFDPLGAGLGQIVAVSEGREATMPFHPQRVPIDAYCAAILDCVEVQAEDGRTNRWTAAAAGPPSKPAGRVNRTT